MGLSLITKHQTRGLLIVGSLLLAGLGLGARDSLFAKQASNPIDIPDNASSNDQENSLSSYVHKELESVQSIGSTANESNTNAHVTINGQSTSLPGGNGSVHKSIPHENGQTDLDISVKTDGSSSNSNSSHSSTDIRIQSQSSEQIEVTEDEAMP